VRIVAFIQITAGMSTQIVLNRKPTVRWKLHYNLLDLRTQQRPGAAEPGRGLQQPGLRIVTSLMDSCYSIYSYVTWNVQGFTCQHWFSAGGLTFDSCRNPDNPRDKLKDPEVRDDKVRYLAHALSSFPANLRLHRLHIRRK
jgi:hypothetical protein